MEPKNILPYSENARRVIFFARYEAAELGSAKIAPEHILLGLLRENKSLLDRFLRSDASLDSIRTRIEEAGGEASPAVDISGGDDSRQSSAGSPERRKSPRKKTLAPPELPLGDGVQRVFTYAGEEAARLGAKNIGTEHLLLGLLREKSVAAGILRDNGFELAGAREEVSHAAQQTRTAFSQKAAPYQQRSTGTERKLNIPVILGTPRQGALSMHAARFIYGQVTERPEISSEFIDIGALNIPVNDAGQSIKPAKFSASMERADALIIVTPEYNHSFPGLLKHVLDTCLKEYIHKAVGIAGVSAGPFGGARVIEHLLPVVRELGLVCIFTDVNFGHVNQTFDSTGHLLDQAFVKRTDDFLNELIWMAKTLRYGRENIAK